MECKKCGCNWTGEIEKCPECQETKNRKTIGWDMLKKECAHNFERWGVWMKRGQLAERKLEKLKALILLTDPAVSNVTMNDLTMRQWQEFIKDFPDENAG